ncbi:hypothetical protein AUJ95_08410 [Candidatus Desantisbacteria bacterium CG2_30_40_21]|uniref:Uncharacterized protein n=5 Tax=unclassified Candidatus Desantisiibacteriota TaxID=3106372 RepID=A0A2M7JBZ0_9BACT|nr:MAG: hypothetical protein AUJ95_08410 [Candidatus Desantisbacteria bacterium CG2_30_40_21]PIP42336.1 MAG: hypothetical protein COX18_00620 [Candidatus Desantisbacteria bacterium CG23_combo_of_CG06-09_8_20_14_all_40_23]PIX16945.1 MAG: hypothetical protein COZ71_05925 [Candidatus Desantisbacteria bacterium CG_4_8_14_3_um_filter_40_12]PIY20200.1 MAG: hypothetical protein COZ13_01460 [Candidatus Desantisbacteria bacterium CG_4_10_14_3_um_filter_40_18]PJB30072.1 MAG: hypothetical protein CO110_02
MAIFSKERCRFRMIIPAYPAFNIYSHVAKNTTALGPVTVATSVKEMVGWDVEVIDENNYRRYGPKNSEGMPDHEYLQQLRPADVVAFYGGLSSTIPRLYEVVKLYKGWGIPTIVGGHHFVGKNIAEGLNNSIDYLILGEGEESIKELLTCIKAQIEPNEVKGVAYLKDEKVVCTPSREPITDFEKFPIPDFSLVRYAKINNYPISRIRGCGSDCEFCMVKGKPRFASAERLVEQISYLTETLKAKEFFVVDDLFGQDRKESIRCCNMLRDYQQKIRKRLAITVQIRLDRSKDPELLQAMREAGINTVAIGFESPIAEELKAMNKCIKPEDMIKMTHVFHKFGFLIHGMFIFGYPVPEGVNFKMSTNERVKRFRTFIKKAKIDTIQVLLTTPLPETELTKRLVAQGRVYPLEEIGWEYYDGNFPLFTPDEPMSSEEMQLGARKIMGKFYRFRNMFMVGLTILSFPYLLFCLHDIKNRWRGWYRGWRNNVIRFFGWAVMREWKSKFNKDKFTEKLEKVKKGRLG